MRPDTQLDYAVFQLNPTRTRCELHISAQGMSYKLAAGLLQPFLAHLKAAEEQIAGGGYSIRLEPPDPGCAGWFTKGTMERFVRFVSTPELLERVSYIEMELMEIEKNIRLQSGDAPEDTQHAEELLSKLAHSIHPNGGMPLAPERLEKPAKESSEGVDLMMEETTKQRLLRALEARHMMLEKELGVALGRAIAAGFSVEHIKDLIVFAETFGAKRLWGACSNFMSLSKTRQQSGLWQDDFKSSAAGVGQAEMAFGGNAVHHMGFRENVDLHGRGSRHDDLRRSSLPSEGRPLLGDTGLEKLTRRSSLDELTGEFLQVAGRMKSSGTMEGPNLDWSSNWQAQGNRPVSGEMQAGFAHLGGNNDLRDSESAFKLNRGHQIMGAWRGQPQNHPRHNVHPLMHGPMHSSLPAPFGFPGLPVPGYSYSPYAGNPYMSHAYAESNGWLFPSPGAPPLRSHPMFNSTATSAANEQGEVVLPVYQQHETHHSTLFKNKLHEALTPSMHKATGELSNMDEFHEKPPTSTLKSANGQPVDNELHKEIPDSTQRPGSELVVNEPSASTEGRTAEPSLESTQRPANDLPADEDTQQTVISHQQLPSNNEREEESTIGLLVDEETQQTVVTQQPLPNRNEREEESTNVFLHDENGESFPERTRRLPIRSSSPSRRSASPLKKVQIGRSGSRRVIRNINHVAEAIPEKIEGENNDKGASSENLSEDNNDGKNVEEPKEQLVRARVQDVIGLFERKKDAGDTKLKPLRKDVGRLPINNPMLKRWTDSGALKKEASEAEKSQIRNGALVASTDYVSEEGSSQLDVLERQGERSSILHEENAEFAVASNFESCFKHIGSEGSSFTWKNLPNGESEGPSDQESSGSSCNLAQSEQSPELDVTVVPDSSKELADKSCNIVINDDDNVPGADIAADIQSGHIKIDLLKSLNDGQEKEDGDLGVNPEATNPKKASARDAKAKAMQELLERRKATLGNRSGKSNPLVDAQLRAEKLRAYKAGLQKSKQEKDEEEKKRIEDLKSQRKERIASRVSPQGGTSAQAPIAKQAPQTAPLTSTKSSPTAISHKISSSSPRNTTHVVASSLSSSLLKSKGAADNKLYRTPKANENALSLSQPSLSELKKESPRATLAVRSSTGSQCLSQMKKNLKDADPNTSPNANGHSEEKRRSLPLATPRKGIPPATDSKNEGSPVVKKPSKGPMTLKKQQKKLDSSPASGNPKKPTREAAEVTFTEQVDAGNDAAVEVIMELSTEAGNEKKECAADIIEASLDNTCSSLEKVGTTEDANDDTQIRAPASIETAVLGSIDDSSCNVDEILSEPMGIQGLKEMEAPMAELEPQMVPMACIDVESTEMDSEKNKEDNYEDNYSAPFAHVSATDDNSTPLEDLDASKEEELNASLVNELPTSRHVSTDECNSSLPAEVYNPPRALPSDSLLHSSKNLPRLHEAIQQAHSPDFIAGVSRSQKTRGDECGSGSTVRSSKDHAKGFKRLLLLGRKSGRSSSPNASEWVSVSMASEVGDDGEDFTGNGKKMGSRSAVANTDSVTRQADKPRNESYSGNPSSKGSRSFFSLSTFRGKGDGK
ncbi:hypothetical protein L7F22_002708 [Adiantum nelumboides]|nr:hypothetical protein [Adiantum nelumboides]